ncbi:hypothetical protein TOPH_02327, partial [Tolypocladium ophioglossoides CBS 100239]
PVQWPPPPGQTATASLAPPRSDSPSSPAAAPLHLRLLPPSPQLLSCSSASPENIPVCQPEPPVLDNKQHHTNTTRARTLSRYHFAMADTVDAPPAANSGSLYETTKTNAAAAFDSVTNGGFAAMPSPSEPLLTLSRVIGPVAQNVQDHSAKASSELSNLAASRKTPTNPAATGQPLTHYHSFFSELLSWKNPRKLRLCLSYPAAVLTAVSQGASAIAYASIVSVIFAARYLDVIRWALRLSWMALAVTVSAESAGKLVLNHGLATQMRPRRYYTVSRATLDSMIGDFHELINFFVIESQRILFAENIGASAAACVAAFISYFLVKLVPYWGLAVIGITVAFFAPLVYTSNKELIDHHLRNASEVINAQTAQVRSVAQKQADHLTTMGKQYAGDYTGKVQEMLRGRSASPVAVTKQPEFPSPPTEEPKKVAAPGPAGEVPEVPEEPVVPEKKPLVAS